MSGGRRNWSGKSTSSLEEIPEAHVAKLKRQLQEREKKKSQGEVPRHDVPREPPLSPSSRARAEEERIHKLYPILPGCLVEKYGISSYVQREAELSAASRPAVAPTPDVVWVPLQATTTDEVPCPVPLSSQDISCPAVTHCNQLSTSKESSTASTSTISDYGLRVQKLVDLQSEEQRGRDRIAVIDRTMEDLHSERKALTDKVLSLKQEQYELLLSTTPNHPFESVNASRYSEQTTTTTNKNPAATESAQPMEESSPVHPIPHADSTELLYLMHQSEEKGVQIALTDAEVVSSLPNSHKRVHSVEENIPANKKMDYKTSPDKLEKGSTNVAVFQPMHSNSTILSVISQSVESSCPNDQTKEISTGKAQTVYEPTVPQPKVAELKVAEQVVQLKVVKSKVVQPKVVDPKIVQTKKSTAASTQKATSNPSKVIAQPSEADSKLPAPATVSNQVKVTAAATPSTSRAACETVSTDPAILPPHLTAVRCVYIHGPCAFTASEDGTVHIYDLETKLLVKKILANTDPVTCLYGISLQTSSEVLSNIKSTTEYLSHLTLVTGSEDAHIRQFALDSGALIDDQLSDYAPTCVAGTKTLKHQYFGTKDGVVLYDPKNKSIRRLNKFTVNGEVICMKIIWIRGKKAIVVAAKQMDPIVFDLETEASLFTLDSSKNSVYCLSSSLKYVFCCDDDKKVIICDAKTGLVNHSHTLPSAALSAFLYRKRFLVLCCMDGVIRVLDSRHRPPYHIFPLPRQGLKTLTCMEVVGETIVGGTLNGEVFYSRLPNLEALSKSL